ncbi:ATP-binding protein [Stenomitos frigidus]|uniref:histidine kinase n=1 Tax=Stenomitos frigidus ULC18 TaxID=2107698 RepID=A0A2T1E374_9CYAN|nr:ATP-binding protein [Stenomitos frigidus]PSB27192.1 hybrid sensor histidine kinase/response regulator [Stenomitos frigidus ULC18]
MKKYSADDLRGDILLVDDTPDNLRVLSAMLTNQGFEVRKALSGQRAIASVRADPPNLILLDIKMPEMDGYTVCQYLKDDPTTCEVPVIFISALDDALDKVRAFAVGGVDYVTKPFQEMEVLARIEHQLRIQKLQQQLMEQNQELARSNRELEQFAYVVSHDLQQPLQSITGFVRLIQLKYQHYLDDVALDYLSRIHDTGSRMQHLIQDLLMYSKVSNQVQELQPIDCNFVLKQVLENLQMAIAEKQVALVCDVLPTVMGSETQLVQLLQNLISNAIKFTRPDTTPQVEISVAKQENQWLFGVHDNGIGIDSHNIERVFEIFQRTQSAKKYPGTGIGLATCKKIVENHGGRIWVTSQLEMGTTFYFTLALA